MKENLCVGLMSGTSMDGVDAALIATDGEAWIESYGNTFLPYPVDFQLLLKSLEYTAKEEKAEFSRMKKMFAKHSSFFFEKVYQLPKATIARLQRQYAIDVDSIIQQSTAFHIQAIQSLQQQCRLKTTDINVIGYHGQTLLHKPQQKKSLQVGDAKSLAKICQTKVVYQFRQNDLQNGGQGAPFAPLYHRALVQRDQLQPAIVVNCGGITNITFVDKQQILAFDVGPGNALLDRYIQKKTQGKFFYDKDASFSKKGHVLKDLIPALYEQCCRTETNTNYFQIKPCKSLDVNDLQLPKAIWDVDFFDACATLAYFTCYCLKDALRFLPKHTNCNWVLVGGGWHNPSLVKNLSSQIPVGHNILNIKDLSWSADALEAEVFAYLALRTLQQKPLSLPTTTGVKAPCTGGILA